VARRLALPLVLAVLAAGCGGKSNSSGTTSTTDWANGLCSAITTWTTSLKTATNSLQGGNVSKDILTSTADDVKSATDTFVDDLKGLGKPDTQAGQQAKASVDKLADELQSDASSIQDAVKGVSGIGDVLTALPTVTTSLGSMSSQFQATFSELQQLDAKGELQNAFQQADSCKSLTQSS
jgi:hypothetical protein